jgi:hypothetical protein
MTDAEKSAAVAADVLMATPGAWAALRARAAGWGERDAYLDGPKTQQLICGSQVIAYCTEHPRPGLWLRWADARSGLRAGWADAPSLVAAKQTVDAWASGFWVFP